MEPCKAPRLEGAGKKHGISTICFTHFFPLKFAISPCNVADQRYQISDDDSGPPRIQGFMEPTEVELRLPRFSLLETLRVALYRSPFLMGFCLAGGFTYFPGEMVQFDEYFSNGLVQPPTSCFWWKNTTSSPWNWRRHTFHSKIPLNCVFQRGKIGICRDPQIIYIDIQQKRSFVLGVFLVEKWFQGLPPLYGWPNKTLGDHHRGVRWVSPSATRPKILRTQRWRFHGCRLEGSRWLLGLDVENATRVMSIQLGRWTFSLIQNPTF